MKIKFILAASATAFGSLLNAATLSVATAVQSQPDAASAVIVVLPAGAEQPTPTDKVSLPPSGWIAVEVVGPFEGYVKNRDLTKALDVKPGSTVYLTPKEGTSALTVFEKGDKAEITGLHGSWTQIHLEKTLVGYIQTGAVTTASIAPSAAPAPQAAPAAAAATSAPSSSAPAATPDSGNASLSRLFEGTLQSTKTILLPRRPYDWQLVGSDGKRVAYVDLSKLLLTDQIENYAGHGVVVLGSLMPVKDTGDLVILVEGLRLK